MRRLIIAALLFMAAECVAQENGEMEAVLTFLGAESPEEVDEEVVELLSHYFARPLNLNRASVSRMTESGLLDRYRAASLYDYRQRHGDILSLSELSMVDGFSEDIVKRLAPFISMESSSLPGEWPAAGRKFSCDLTVKAGAKHNEEMLWTGGVKARMEAGNRLSALLAFTSPYGRFEHEKFTYSASVMCRCPELHTDFIIGDFNARFGQGLALWNGLSLSSLSSPSAFMKNPTGISQSASFTGNYSYTGMGVKTSVRRLAVSGFVAFPGIKTLNGKLPELMPGVNLTYYGRHGQLAATYVSGLISADVRWCIDGVDVFAESVYDWAGRVPAALGGTVFPAGEHMKVAAMLRYYPVRFNSEHSGAMCSSTSAENEYGTSISVEYGLTGRHRAVAVVDAAHLPEPKKNDRGGSMQVKGLLQWEWHMLEWISLKFRFTERYRTWGDAFRSDVRADLQTSLDAFRVNLRLNALKCRDWGMLSYLEGGYEGERMNIWLRQGFFRIDDWNDRIYAYERGAPGGFRVPAYYGRGLWTALTVSMRFINAGRLYLRTSYTGYPFMAIEKRKPGKAELEIQYVCRF